MNTWTKKLNETVKEFESKVDDKNLLEKIKKFEKEGKRFNKEDLPDEMNAYGRNLIMPLWSNEILIEDASHAINHAQNEFNKTYKYSLDDSYNDFLKHKYIHMLVKRLSEKINILTSEEFSNLRELLRLLYGYGKVIIEKFEFVDTNITFGLSILDVDYGEICESSRDLTIPIESISTLTDVMQYYKFINLKSMLKYHTSKEVDYQVKIDNLRQKNIDLDLNNVSTSKIISDAVRKQKNKNIIKINFTKKIVKKLNYFYGLDGNWRCIPITKEDIRCYQFRMITPDIEKYITHEDKDDEIFEPLM